MNYPLYVFQVPLFFTSTPNSIISFFSLHNMPQVYMLSLFKRRQMMFVKTGSWYADVIQVKTEFCTLGFAH